MREYIATVETSDARGIIPKGTKRSFGDNDPPCADQWHPVGGVWPEVKREAKPEQAEGGSAGHWSDIPHDEVTDALRAFETPDEFLRVLALGMAIAGAHVENAKPANPDAVTGQAQAAEAPSTGSASGAGEGLSTGAAGTAEAPNADASTGATEASSSASTTTPAPGRATARVKPGAKA